MTSVQFSSVTPFCTRWVRTLDRGFDSWSDRYQVVITGMGDCLWTSNQFPYITNTKVNSAFIPLG